MVLKRHFQKVHLSLKMVQTRGRQQQQIARKELMLGLAKDSMSLLLELGYVINQCYGNRPPHEMQRALRRKNELVSRLETFVGSQQSSREEDNTAQEREQLQASVERLQKQLLDQSAEFEQERARLQQQATVTLNAQSELNSSLNRVLPQLRGLLDAYERERGQHVDLSQDSAAAACAATSTRTVTLAQSPNCTQDLTQRLTQLQTEFDAERALLLEQASAAADTQQDISRRNLTEREAALTCPISLDLFENPVVTECCGKTFSSEALNQALRRNSQCPVCRAHRVASYANRDMANLVELHRHERSLLGLPDTAAASATAAAEARVVTEERATAATESPTQLRQLAVAARQSQSRNQRNQRVQARAAVPHRPSSTTTQSNTMSTSTPPGSNRGRRRGGRNSNPRRHRSSRTSSSPTPSASSRASGAQSTPSAQSWSYDSRPSTANAAAPASSTDYSYIRSWVPRDVDSSSYRSAPSSNTAPTQSSTSTGYGRAPLDDGFNPYPYGYGYFDSDSDY